MNEEGRGSRSRDIGEEAVESHKAKNDEPKLPKAGDEFAWNDPEYARMQGWCDENGKLTKLGAEEVAFIAAQKIKSRENRPEPAAPGSAKAAPRTYGKVRSFVSGQTDGSLKKGAEKLKPKTPEVKNPEPEMDAKKFEGEAKKKFMRHMTYEELLQEMKKLQLITMIGPSGYTIEIFSGTGGERKSELRSNAKTGQKALEQFELLLNNKFVGK